MMWLLVLVRHAAEIMVAGPVIAAGALTVGAARAVVAGVSFIRSSAHVAGRIPYNGVQVVKSHFAH